MDELTSKIKYQFKDAALLRRALTHSSYANEMRLPEGSNERLEFLGDSVLSIIVSDYLFKNYSHLPEGELTKLRAGLVCERTLCGFSRSLGLGGALLLGKGEQNTGGRERPSILADAFEALIAAVYLDGGLNAARGFVLEFVTAELKNAGTAPVLRDYKTTLQEIVQQTPEEHLEYVGTGESGPDHYKIFSVEVRLNSNVIGRGEGKSKKEAEQAAAREALKLFGE